jgi:hypothetical protein
MEDITEPLAAVIAEPKGGVRTTNGGYMASINEYIDRDAFVALKEKVERHEHILCGNGQPGLEEKLKDYVDKRDEHKARSTAQAMLQITHVQDKRHEENTSNFAGLSKLVYIGVGIVITLQFVVIIMVAFFKH